MAILTKHKVFQPNVLGKIQLAIAITSNLQGIVLERV